MTSPGASPSALVVRLALRCGVGLGVLYGLWSAGLHLSGQNAFGPKRLLAQFALPLAVVGSQWWLRQASRPVAPGLGRALAVGGLTALIGAGLVAASVAGLGRGAGPAATVRNQQEMVQIARAERDYLVKQGGERGYQQQVAQLARLTPGDVARNDFSKLVFLGLVFGLPGGVFFRE